MPDRPRRILPVPGVLDIDSVEDANVAEAFGRDEADDETTAGDRPAAEGAPDAPDEGLEAPAPEADPLGPPAPPPLDDDAPDAPPAEDPVEAPTDGPGLEAAAPDAPGDPPEDAGDEAEGTPEEPGAPIVEDPDAPPPSPTPPDEPGDPAAGLEADSAEADSAEADSAEADSAEADAVDPAPPTGETEPLEVVSVEAIEAPRVEAPRALPSPSPEVVETAKSATRDRGRELVQLVVRYGQAHVPEPPQRVEAPDEGPPRMVGRVGQLIPVLRVIPWLLAALFALSFWWDFDGQAVALFGRTFEIEGLLRVLTVSGLIGFGTNWLAITMLFQPREKRAIIPQGLIPAQRERVIYRLSGAISKELINADIIKQKIQASGVIGRYRDLALGVVRGVVEDPAFRADLKQLAQDYAQEVLGSEPVRREVARLAVQKVEEQAGGGLGGVALRLYRTFAEDDFQRRVDRALDELPEAVAPLLDRIDVALDAVPPRVEAHADEIEEVATKAVLSFVEGFDVRSMISERARQFDEGQLEGLLKSTSNEQLNYIKYLGAILGVFGGFVIWEPVGALVVFGAVALLLWGLDEALVRARRAREGA